MRVIGRLLTFVFKYPWQLATAYLSLILATASALAMPKFLGWAIDAALRSGTWRFLLLSALGIVLVSLSRGFFTYWQTFLAEWISQKVAYDLRNTIYDKLQRMSFAYHDHQQTGQLMSRATADVEGVRWWVNMGAIRIFQTVFLFLGAVALVLMINWKLSLIGFAVLPFVAVRAAQVHSSLRKIWLAVQQTMAELTTVLQENLSGVRVVRAFGQEDQETAKFSKKAAEVAQYQLDANRVQAINAPLMNLFLTLAVGVTLWYGGRLVILKQLTHGELVQFIFYLTLLTQPVRMIGWTVNLFSRAASSGQRIFEILDARSPVEERPGARELAKVEGHVRFEEVSFSYDSRAPALKHISFEARPGQVTALLGATGSGKTTVVHLLPRFYDVSSGRITLDGQDVRDLKLNFLRGQIGIVQQDVFLFSDTIRGNIAYGRLGASTDDIVAAAKAARLHDFIQGLPEGYNTWVGERGITLSGGQKQRLAIARTLLLNPAVLILDDSTSSVDMETEQLIRQALSELIRGRTTFIIAQRLSSVMQADLILVLQDGEIVERGTHGELLARRGVYREIYELQLKPQEETLVQQDGVGPRGQEAGMEYQRQRMGGSQV